MARPRKKIATPASNSFLEALKFVGTVLKDTGTINETHCLLNNGYAIAANGIVSVGIKIENTISAAPNYALLMAALSKAPEPEISIDGDKLTIKSGKFKAIIPCIDPVLINLASVDNPTKNEINEEFKRGLEAVEVLANENGQSIVTASILITNQSFISTNTVVIFEYWHGNNFDFTLAVPKQFIKVLNSISKDIKAIGYSESSLTIWFTDDSFIKTQLFKNEWPNIYDVLNLPANPLPISKDFFEALTSISPFSEDGLIYTENDLMKSHHAKEKGASFETKGLPHGLILSIKQIDLLKSWVKEIDFFAIAPNKRTCIKAFGGKMRAMIAGRI